MPGSGTGTPPELPPPQLPPELLEDDELESEEEEITIIGIVSVNTF